MHSPLPAFAATAGPRPARILFLAEAWGKSEAETRQPLVGESGKEFWRMLGEAWPIEAASPSYAAAIEMQRYDNAWIGKRADWMREVGFAYTNVFAFRPPENKLEHISGSKKEVEALAAALGASYDLPGIKQGQYIQPEYLTELLRLDEEITAFEPNLIVALGNVAMWAVCRETNIGSIRGTIRQSRPIGGRKYKVLPTFHPAAILRQWAWRPLVVGDLMKARREAASPEITRPRREIIVKPKLADIERWVGETLASRTPLLACDTETSRGQITMIGFARSANEALLTPFSLMAPQGGSWNYWPEAWMEERARELANELLRSRIPKVFQNGMYDFQYLLREGFELNACVEDTMLLHHSILPEMRKGLGFLGSVYTDEPAWKLDRLVKADTEKRDE